MGSFLGLLPAILLLPCVLEVLQLWNSKTSFHFSQSFVNGIDFGVGHHRILDLDLGGGRARQCVGTLLSAPPEELSGTALARPHALGTNSPEQMPPEPDEAVL